MAYVRSPVGILHRAMQSALSSPPKPPAKRKQLRVAALAVANAPTTTLQRLHGLGSLGDDAPAAPTPTPMTETEWRTQMLAKADEVVSWQAWWVKRDELQRWMQLGATLAIPLSAAIWKMIFRAGKKASEET